MLLTLKNRALTKLYNSGMNHKKRNDIILIAIIIIAAALLLFIKSGRLGSLSISDNGLSSGLSIVITVDDKEVYREQADRVQFPAEIDIDGYSGGHNVFIINKNDQDNIEISCTEADCPDRICVETGKVSTPDQPIVCLPHRVTARIVKNSV